MNLKIRMKNWSFWLSIALAVFAPIGAYYGLTGADMTTWDAVWDVLRSAAGNPYVLLTIAVSVYNALIDPTSSGITDSALAKSYTEPNGD